MNSGFSTPSPRRGRTNSEVRPSIRDVAKMAGVGLGTVSRVMNDHPNVSEDKRQRVKDAIRQLGYVPDIVAQSLRNHRSKTFACVMRDFTVPVLSMFVDSMQKEIDAYGFSLIVASSYHDPRREIELLRGMQQRRVDGLVIATASEEDSVLLEALRDMSIPIVLLDRQVPAELDAVSVNHAKGIREAVHYLVDLGHRRIAIISGETAIRATRDRLDGYASALEECGIDVDPALVRSASFDRDAGYMQAKALLTLADPPTAMIAGGTSLLPGVVQATRDCGLSIPDDVSIIAGADSDVAKLSTPPFTVVRWSHDELGKAAGRFLMERLDNPGLPPRRLVVDAELVRRGSCASPKRVDNQS